MVNYLIVCLLAFGFFACAKKEEASKMMGMGTSEMHEHTGQQYGAEAVEAIKEDAAVMRASRADEVGKDVVCPVMGTKFKIKANTEAADYKGKSYYFCCGYCPGEFMNSPEKYAK